MHASNHFAQPNAARAGHSTSGLQSLLGQTSSETSVPTSFLLCRWSVLEVVLMRSTAAVYSSEAVTYEMVSSFFTITGALSSADLTGGKLFSAYDTLMGIQHASDSALRTCRSRQVSCAAQFDGRHRGARTLHFGLDPPRPTLPLLKPELIPSRTGVGTHAHTQTPVDDARCRKQRHHESLCPLEAVDRQR